LACVYKIQFQNRPEKYVSALIFRWLWKLSRLSEKSLHWCQKALNDISAQHAVGLYWVPGHAGVRGNEIADELAGGSSLQGFLGTEPSLRVSRRDIPKRISRWLANQQWVQWRGLGDTQRQTQEPVWVPRPSFCPLTGHNPGLLLAFSMDIIPWGDILTYLGCWTVHCVRGVETRK
jgi:hypothetical protein